MVLHKDQHYSDFAVKESNEKIVIKLFTAILPTRYRILCDLSRSLMQVRML